LEKATYGGLAIFYISRKLRESPLPNHT
jgi:hypothetical protein